jgi:hypothetical protein
LNVKHAPPIQKENGLKDKEEKRRAAAERHYTMVGLNLQPATNKASFGRKAALGLRQIAALMAPSVSTQSQSLLRAPSCRQCGNFLRLSNVEQNLR